jgi:hypothetical protein
VAEENAIHHLEKEKKTNPKKMHVQTATFTPFSFRRRHLITESRRLCRLRYGCRQKGMGS